MPNQADPGAGRRRLNSWKEIAQFFGRAVRTVQDWEKHEGLPVHRHRHRHQNSVYADTDELDAWWRQHPMPVPEPLPDTLPDRLPVEAAVRRPWAMRVAVVLMAASVGVLAAYSLRRAPDTGRFPIKTFENLTSGSMLLGGVAGDVNADGIDDAVVSAYMAGEVYVVYGGRALPDRATLPPAANIVIRSTTPGWLQATGLADLNGDGTRDLIVRDVLREPDSYRGSGSSYILWGRSRWPAALTLPADADVTLRLDRAPDGGMGACLASGPADLNGDGTDDLILSAVEYGDGDLKSAGAMFVLFGRASWPRDLEVAASADVTVRGARMGEGLGVPCTTGDFDGDGVLDVAAYANENRLWNLLGSRGRLYVFRGGAWPRLVDAATAFLFRIDGVRPNAAVGGLAAADFDGDGIDDLAASLPRVDGDAAHRGELRLWFGGRARPRVSTADAADVVIDGGVPGARMGDQLSVGDIDRDGISDLVLPDPARGELQLVYGRRHWAARGTLAAYAPIALATHGSGDSAWEVAAADLDGDRLNELVVALPEARTSAGPGSGQVWIVKPYVAVRLDVRPGFETNALILPDGLLVARVYGWSREPRDRIDPSTVRLAGASPTRVVAEDYDGDGREDLQLYFQTATMRLSQDATRIALTARTVAGTPIGGTDAILVVTTDAALRDR